jgi:hypothetical protein
MSQNRFLTFGNTTELAKENTLAAIKEKLDLGITVTPQPNSTVVISDVNFQTSQTSMLSTNLSSLNNNTISTGLGTTDSGTQRVTIASDSPLNAELNVSKDKGNSDSNTLRVVMINDQEYLTSASQPVQLSRSSYPWMFHMVTHVSNPPVAATSINILNPSHQACGSLISPTDNLAYNFQGGLNVIIPSTPAIHFIASSSPDDNATGPGLRTVIVHYYMTEFAPIISSQPVTLNGTTGVSLGLVYRIISVTPTSIGTQYNYGNIQVFTNGIPVPGLIPAGQISWRSGHIYVPPLTGGSHNGTIYRGKLLFDYINITSENTGGDSEILRLVNYNPANNITYPLQEFRNNTSLASSFDLKSAVLQVTQGIDFIITYTRKTTAGVMYISAAIGMYIE